jgi:hypothetical protein
LFFSSCKKQSELHSYSGYVVNPQNEPVVSATIQIFETPEDWLTGHNIVATMQSDLAGHFESEKIFESGDYYVFVEKLDSSNWEIREVEKGIYPKVSIPFSNGSYEVIDFNNMSLMANTKWKLTNVHREYTKPNHTAIEWQSIWTSINNCRRDNAIYFNKDLSMRISEGDVICSKQERNVLANFVPPIIFSSNSCTNLPNTSQDVKEFEYYNWPELKAKSGKMFMACNQSVGQLYIYYKSDDGRMMLDVYSRRE